MRQFEPLMLEHVKIFLQHLLKASRKKEPVNMSDRSKRLGTDIIGRFGFGYFLNLQTEETNSFVIPGLTGASYKNNVYIQAPMVRYFGLQFFFPKLYALRMKYYFLLKKMVKDRLAEGQTAKEDLFSYVMDAKDPETGTKIRLELVSEATFFFPAGKFQCINHLRLKLTCKGRYNGHDNSCRFLLSFARYKLLQKSNLRDSTNVFFSERDSIRAPPL